MTAIDTYGFLGTTDTQVNAQLLTDNMMERIAALEALALELETL